MQEKEKKEEMAAQEEATKASWHQITLGWLVCTALFSGVDMKDLCLFFLFFLSLTFVCGYA